MNYRQATAADVPRLKSGGQVIHGHTIGGKPSRTYRSWCAMRERCHNPNHVAWKYYGCRGIKVCPAWHGFQAFLADMGERPAGHTIERVNNNGNYEPNNCKWAARHEQSRNRRVTGHWITFNGQTKTIKDWAAISPVSRKGFAQRLRLGWSMDDALSVSRKRLGRPR